MKKLITASIIFFVIISSATAKKKNTAQPELDSGTIEQQFDYIITKSSKFRDFQLIRKTSILKVKAHTLDSIKTVRKDLINANKTVTQIQGKIGQLESEIQTLKDEIETVSVEVDSISFFGSPVSKSLYNSIVWGIITVLFLFLIIIIARFKSSSSTTKNAKNDLDKLGNEFEEFRKKSMTKEQETMRKLQDEINKNNP